MNPFILIERNNLLDLKKYLATENPNVVNNYGDSLLHLAVKLNNIEIMNLLLDNYININYQDRLGNTALMLSVIYNNVGFVKLLLRYKADINIANNLNETPLFKALYLNREDIVEILLLNNPLLNEITQNYESNLFAAVYSGNKDLISKALAFNSLNDKNYLGDSLIHTACKANKVDSLTFLLEKGLSPHITNKLGETPLFDACRRESPDLVVTLMKYGSLLEYKNNNGERVFDLELNKDFKRILKRLQMSKEYVSYLNNYPLHVACIYSDIELVEKYLNIPNIQKKDQFQKRAYDYAKLKENKDILKCFSRHI